jgi:alpha-mannosidase
VPLGANHDNLTQRTAKSYWYSGTWSSRVRVWFGDQLTVPALETKVPLLACVGTGPRGTLPSSQPGVKLSRPGVLVTALKQKAKGKVTFMRLWELAGDSGKVTVHHPAGITRTHRWTCRPTRHFAGPTNRSPSRSFEFALSCFAPASFELE